MQDFPQIIAVNYFNSYKSFHISNKCSFLVNFCPKLITSDNGTHAANNYQHHRYIDVFIPGWFSFVDSNLFQPPPPNPWLILNQTNNFVFTTWCRDKTPHGDRICFVEWMQPRSQWPQCLLFIYRDAIYWHIW